MGASLAYSAKCIYRFSAIAKENLCNTIKTVNEAVDMTEAKISLQIATVVCKETICDFKGSLGFCFIYFCGKMFIKE